MATTARVAALRLLATRRLSESQLWKKLETRGYAGAAILEAITSCKRDGYLDDRLFATLYVEGPRKAVGDKRLVAELVKRGIDRSIAQEAVAAAPTGQDDRIEAAYARMRARKEDVSYQAAAHGLERLGFPASLIYRVLRGHAAAELDGRIADAQIAHDPCQ
jgi:SOS response regulatory protein OraA/RecX